MYTYFNNNGANKMNTFTIIGYSVLDGQRRIRMSNDLASRVKILQRNGDTEIELYQVEDHWPGAIVSNKLEASALLAAHPTFARPLGPVVQAVEPEVEPEVVQTVEPEVVQTVEPEVVQAVEPEVEVPTFEMILATIPLRENGRFVKRTVREEQARQKLAELTA
jgi:hypothetical protein